MTTLPSEDFTLQGYDFASQIRKIWDLIQRAKVTPRIPTVFEAYLSRRVAGARGDAWIDRLELHVASRACEIFGLLLARGPDGKLSGHGEAEWARFGQLGFDVFRPGADVVTNELAQSLSRPGVDGRFFSRVYEPFTTWLNGRGLGDLWRSRSCSSGATKVME